MKHRSKLLRISCRVLLTLCAAGAVSAAEPTPVHPEAANFNFLRGVVRAYEPGEMLGITETDGDHRALRVADDVPVLNQAGVPVGAKALKPGADVTVTVRDPRDAQAVSIVHKIVVANPLDDTVSRTPVIGLVARVDEAEDVMLLTPQSAAAELIPILYNEGETEFVGADGMDVREEQLDAGDSVSVYTSPQKEGGLLANRVIFHGDSGDPAGVD